MSDPKWRGFDDFFADCPPAHPGINPRTPKPELVAWAMAQAQQRRQQKAQATAAAAAATRRRRDALPDGAAPPSVARGSFVSPPDDKSAVPSIPRQMNKCRHGRKDVVQRRLDDGTIIATYPSLKSACDALGGGAELYGELGQAVRTGAPVRGFLWGHPSPI